MAHHLQSTAVSLYAYVLLDNHFHILVRTPRANLSAFMQRLLTAYALYARYKHRRPGHLFQGRFKAKLVEGDAYLLAVTRYIHLNPVKIAACRRMNGQQRLDRLEAYAWSSYGGYAAAGKVQEFVTYDGGARGQTYALHYSSGPRLNGTALHLRALHDILTACLVHHASIFLTPSIM